MPVIRCYVDDRTMEALERFSVVDGRTVEQLAEAAIEEQAIRSSRGHDLPREHWSPRAPDLGVLPHG